MKKKIKLWMLENDVKSKDVAEDLRVTRSMVSHWLAGRHVSARIRQWFIDRGCPELDVIADHAGR